MKDDSPQYLYSHTIFCYQGIMPFAAPWNSKYHQKLNNSLKIFYCALSAFLQPNALKSLRRVWKYF